MSADLSQVDAKIDEIELTFVAVDDSLCVAWLPPEGSLAHDAVGQPTFRIVSRPCRQFFVAAKRNDADPLLRIDHLVGFHADKRIRAHPGYFLSHSREAVEQAKMASKVERRDVGLTVPFASQPTDVMSS